MRDVIVVGGSIAGSAAAIHLARAGRDVVLVERRSHNGRKVCGEGLFPRGVRELEALGILESIRPRCAALSGIRFHAGENSVVAPFGRGQAIGLGVHRADLAPVLLERACAAGVEVRLGVTVRALSMEGDLATGVETDGGEIRARVIIGADGLDSRLRQQARLGRSGRSKRYGVSAHLDLHRDAGDFVDVHFAQGYELYVTPIAGNIVNVALLLNGGSLQRDGRGLRETFLAMLGHHPGFLAGADLIDEPLASGRFGVSCDRPWRRNLVLVGDAAGFMDAINGEGMSAALISARHCAHAVDRYLRIADDDAFRDYAIARGRVVRNTDLLSRVSLALASQPRLARLAVRNLARRPEAFAHLVGISTGELPLRALRFSDVRGLALGV